MLQESGGRIENHVRLQGNMEIKNCGEGNSNLWRRSQARLNPRSGADGQSTASSKFRFPDLSSPRQDRFTFNVNTSFWAPEDADRMRLKIVDQSPPFHARIRVREYQICPPHDYEALPQEARRTIHCRFQEGFQPHGVHLLDTIFHHQSRDRRRTIIG